MFGTGPRSELEPSVRAFRTVLLLAQRLRYLMDDRLRPDGLTTRQAALLTAVSALGNPSLTEAARALGSTHQNVAQLVDALVRKDLLEVHADPADKRRRLLRVTSTNEVFWQHRNVEDHAAVADWFAGLSPAELQTLCDLTDRVIVHLKSADG